MRPPIYMVNLDRRTDRLDEMRPRLAALGLDWERVAATDATACPAGPLHPRVATDGHLIPMGRGSQAFAATLLDLFERLLAVPGDDAAGVIVLQDDVVLSRDLAVLARDDSWIPPGIGLVQLEKWQERKPRKLLGPPLAEMPGAATPRSLRRLHMRSAGAAAFWIRRRVMRMIVEGDFQVRFPSDHLLFSPNVSPVFDRAGVAFCTPALAMQPNTSPSDMKPENAQMRRDTRRHRRAALRRSLTEVNRAPRQLALLASGKARLMDPGYAD